MLATPPRLSRRFRVRLRQTQTQAANPREAVSSAVARSPFILLPPFYCRHPLPTSALIFAVVISGYNFGATFTGVQVFCTLTMQIPYANTKTIPFGGNTTFVPQCNMSTPHYGLTCNVPPGGGTNLAWTVIVHGQVNVQPTTSYAPPLATSLLMPPGISSLATTGGQNVTLLGQDFGVPGLLQSISYGPSTGSEFVVNSWTWLSSNAVSFITVPGAGLRNIVALTVADQVGPVSLPLLNYSAPTIQTVDPAQGYTYSDPQLVPVIKVSGYNFGLSNPNKVGVVVGFGNAGDGTFKQYKATPVVLADFPGQLETVTFLLPSGVGPSRAVRVFPYVRSQGDPPADALVLATPVTAVFSYYAPVLAGVSTSVVYSYSSQLADCISSGTFPNIAGEHVLACGTAF